jgi:hypothetical protein
VIFPFEKNIYKIIANRALTLILIINLTFKYRSMIITGCSPWTLYELKSFQGQSACWYPADTQKCYPAFFSTAELMKGWANQVSSVRRGCHSHNRFYANKLVHEGGNGSHFIQS